MASPVHCRARMDRALVVAVVGLAGCAAQVPMEEFCQREAQSECESLQRCGLKSAAIDCAKAELFDDCLWPYRPALEAGVMRYDGVAAAACLSAISEHKCEDGLLVFVRRGDEACQAVVVGQATEGQPCGVCAAGLQCNATALSCGVCVKTPVTSSALPGESEPCLSPIGDGPGCRPGFFCRSQPSSQARCVRQPGLGEACTDEVPCNLGSNCVEGVCVALAKAGEPCAPRGCEAGLYCDASGACAVPGPSGSACSSDEACALFNCVDGVCRGAPREGQPCPEGGFCSNTLACHDGVCVARVPVGGACSGSDCAGFGVCVDGVCRDATLECR